ncbi:MAG: 1,4-dihydroxy-2-naphthoate polyprenyltransferase [Actinomycetota bacterium]|nr:1,4-dihydroxy-2-naphthoate polyprenyltransferase [Actinomycetota bacterium]
MRTLPLAIAPVYLGSAVAFTLDRFDPVLALLALVVSLFLQIGVNYANDYSDGIRGTDDDRVGPKRITAAGLARPDAVKRAAFITFGIAMAAGLVIVVVTSQWWLLGIGALAVLAAWFYTGGKSPYGYAGLGEVAVFVFFGLVATVGTNFIQTLLIDPLAVLVGIAFGFYATAVLLVNNIRDIDTDTKAGKKTLAVRLGRKASKTLFMLLIWLPVALNFLILLAYPAAILGMLNLLLVLPVTLIIMESRNPGELITALKLTSFAGLGFAVLVGTGIALVSLSF